MAKSPAQRKKEQRERDAQRLVDLGAQALNMTIYNGTRLALDSLKLAGGFEQDEEVITLLLHNADKILKRDKSQLTNLLGFNK